MSTAPAKEASLAIAEQPRQLTVKDYTTPEHNTWCAGCGDFAILNGIQRALADLQIPPHKVAVFSGIGSRSSISRNCL